MKKIAKLGLLISTLAMVGCNSNEDNAEGLTKDNIKIGLICLHDNSSTYDKNFIESMYRAVENLGMSRDQVKLTTGIPEGSECYDEAVKMAATVTDDKPVVFADVADNPGAGGSSDGTYVLRRMLDLGVKDAAFATILDPEVVKIAEKAGVGSEIEITLGGKTCPEVAGEPIHTKAIVKTITDAVHVDHFGTNKGLTRNFGRSVVLDISGILVIVNSTNVQPSASEIFECVGINPLYMKILVVKSTIHYRASFGRFTDHLIDVQVPGLCPQHPSMVNYKKVKRPIFPLDNI